MTQVAEQCGSDGYRVFCDPNWIYLKYGEYYLARTVKGIDSAEQGSLELTSHWNDSDVTERFVRRFMRESAGWYIHFSNEEIEQGLNSGLFGKWGVFKEPSKRIIFDYE